MPTNQIKANAPTRLSIVLIASQIFSLPVIQSPPNDHYIPFVNYDVYFLPLITAALAASIAFEFRQVKSDFLQTLQSFGFVVFLLVDPRHFKRVL